MSNGSMDCEGNGKQMWKEVVVSLKVLPQNFPGGICQNHEKSQVSLPPGLDLKCDLQDMREE